jgi:hypothetical protein
MVAPLHAKPPTAKDSGDADANEKPLITPEQAAAHKRNTQALMRRQGWDFPDPPLAVAPASPEQPLSETRARVAAAIDSLDGWLKGRASLEAELSAAKREEDEALDLSSGDRAKRTRRIADAQVAQRILAAISRTTRKTSIRWSMKCALLAISCAWRLTACTRNVTPHGSKPHTN